MLISLRSLIARYGLRLRGAIHVGAHLGQEAQIYHDCGLAEVLWIEANPALLDELRANVAPFGHTVVAACLGPTSGAKVILNLSDDPKGTNRGQSSSVLPLGLHRQRYPDISYVGSIDLTTRTLDSVVDEQGATGSNLLNVDVQGYELHVLEGAERTLPQFDCVYVEVNFDELYEGCALLPDLDAFLEDRGLTRVKTWLWGSQYRDERDGETWSGWGEAVWVRSGFRRSSRWRAWWRERRILPAALPPKPPEVLAAKNSTRQHDGACATRRSRHFCASPRRRTAAPPAGPGARTTASRVQPPGDWEALQ